MSSGKEPAMAGDVIYLHGDLDLRIIKARCLPNMDLLSEGARRVFSVFASCTAPVTQGCSISVHDDGDKKQRKVHSKIITSDPYVKVCLAGATVARTRVISNSADPEWNERFSIPLAHPVSKVDFIVKDDDFFGTDMIGTASVPADKINEGEEIEDWFPIIGPNGKPAKARAAIFLKLKFSSCAVNDKYRSGGGGHGVERSYFPMRGGGAVTLYQDAHGDPTLPKVELDGGKIYGQENCWEDICHAILEAHHLVYIAGWSIYHKVKLARETTKKLPNGGDLNLGELLKYKSQEGVRVLLLVWDDQTSHSKFFINTKGIMDTHDEETKKFFKHSSVVCVLSPRYGSSKLSVIKQKVVGTLYTHHQKCVIVDSQAPGNNRKISAFLGGLDMCDGRYDTPEHRLFRNLETVFKDDFHNPCVPAGTKGPRQPWHDLHCRIEGPAAYDVLTNFEERWRKASKWYQIRRSFRKISRWNDDHLLKVGRMSWILSPLSSSSGDDTNLWVRDENDPESWRVQVFRSIDSGSVKGFPKGVQAIEAQNLVRAKHLLIDKSMQMAYIEAIRSAQHFIYIENQYFIGSSYAWPVNKQAGADNSIPMELALKIASKIKAKERFAVYIVIPMWPEGNTSSASVQQILYWQNQTMQMMYELIANELKGVDLEGITVQDYLNFYCLGNRETPPADGSDSDQQSNSSSEPVSVSQKNGRFMIYVHAKGMIVDDEYVIIGSANINQRSMAGSRDTEIAMGAYQPHHTWAEKKAHPRGQVHGYRMSLWAEHLGNLHDSYMEPESLDCVRNVNNIARENWKKYIASSHTSLQGHILKYPIIVDNNGKISAIPNQDQFPDFGGRILGSPTPLPDALTT
ncbi:hypothetical protein V2J09_023932 [Rumex salicifolius]